MKRQLSKARDRERSHGALSGTWQARRRREAGRVGWLRWGWRRIAHPLGNLDPEARRHPVREPPAERSRSLLVGALQQAAEIVCATRRQASLVVWAVPDPHGDLGARARVLR